MQFLFSQQNTKEEQDLRADNLLPWGSQPHLPLCPCVQEASGTIAQGLNQGRLHSGGILSTRDCRASSLGLHVPPSWDTWVPSQFCHSQEYKGDRFSPKCNGSHNAGTQVSKGPREGSPSRLGGTQGPTEPLRTGGHKGQNLRPSLTNMEPTSRVFSGWGWSPPPLGPQRLGWWSNPSVLLQSTTEF